MTVARLEQGAEFEDAFLAAEFDEFDAMLESAMSGSRLDRDIGPITGGQFVSLFVSILPESLLRSFDLLLHGNCERSHERIK